MSEKIHVTPSGGNVFVDLGFDAGEAEQLREESNRRIKAEILEPELKPQQPDNESGAQGGT